MFSKPLSFVVRCETFASEFFLFCIDVYDVGCHLTNDLVSFYACMTLAKLFYAHVTDIQLDIFFPSVVDLFGSILHSPIII